MKTLEGAIENLSHRDDGTSRIVSTFVVAGPPSDQTPTDGGGPGLIGLGLIAVVVLAGLGLLALWVWSSREESEEDDSSEGTEDDAEQAEGADEATEQDGEAEESGGKDSG